ncbi:MAG TPA: MFS transporter, partial [Pedomonas sp.]|nr:MFS transporter [Pedomonas sp.]
MTSQALAGSREGRLPLATCVGWGVGTLAVAALFNSVNVLLLRYLVDYVGLGAAVAGTILALSKLFDAVIDPLIGSLSDRTRSRHGRRRPFVLAGGVMLAAAAVLLFNIPSNLSPNAALALATGALLFYAAAYATFSVPYMAMPAEMTGNVHERSRLISYRVYAVAAASMVATFIGPLLIAKAGGGQAGHTVMSLFIATLVLVSTFVCFHATRDVAAADVAVSTHEKISFSRKLELILSNRPFMAL